MEKSAKILILGSNGMVGKRITQRLKNDGYTDVFTPQSLNLDLRNQQYTLDYFEMVEPDYTIMAAARVGGIFANINSPATFGYDNLMMELNVIEAARQSGVKKLLFVASSCAYPRDCPQPMKEDFLLCGKPESTNEMYSIAKITGIKLCQAYRKQYAKNFISCLPCNLYGPGDNFNPDTSHVLSALVQRFHYAKIDNLPFVMCFGTGQAKREFLFVEDVVDALLFLMDNYNDEEHINVGCGNDISIYDLAYKIASIVGYTGGIQFDATKPDGMPRKVLDVSKMTNLGWTAKKTLDDGIKDTYKWFLENYTDE
jgi:GDP-L-fucose synthase